MDTDTYTCDPVAAEEHYRRFMEAVGMDIKGPHAAGTPARVAKMFCGEFTQGLRDPDFEFTAFPMDSRHTYDQLIVVKGIPLASICAHHHVPFIGKCHVAYLPDEKIIGLSKISRVVRWMARKPSIQEDLTEEIASALEKALSPRAVCVLIEAEHYCVSIRGISQPGTLTMTHCIKGIARDNPGLKDEFLQLVKGGR